MEGKGGKGIEKERGKQEAKGRGRDLPD